MTSNPEIKLIEKCRVTPPPDAVPELTLPLTFYDLQWLLLPPSQHLHFYRFHHPSPPASHIIISSLKSSLSLVLKNFLPLAGNLIWPVDSSSDRMPELRYLKGDFVSLTVAESSMDFDYLVGDHQRESYKFYHLLPQLLEPLVTSGDQVSPVFALQVTVFPNSGISLGCTFCHVVCDGTSLFNFSESWASINKLNGDSSEPLAAPSYDRSVVQDPYHLDRKIFNDIKLIKSQRSHRIPNPTVCKDKVQATFILHRSDIEKLKRFVSMRTTSSTSNKNVSAFVVSSALIWTCLSKPSDVVDEKVDNDQLEYLCAYINCRQRFDPPMPQNYFGNCMVPCLVGSTHRQLAGNEGLFEVASAIRDAIHKRVYDDEGILRGDWIPHSHAQILAVEPGMLDINGTTQHNVYNDNADFDWGKLEKQECVSMYSSATIMLISLSRRFEGALEFGISFPKNIMDAFTIIFTNSINSLHEEPSLGK